jgi:small subunit ribosomal protein S2
MKPYIYGQRDGIYIINLQKTIGLFRDALNQVQSTVSHGGTVLFVGTKRQAQATIKEEAARAGMPYVNNRWLGGMLTNYKTIRKSIERVDAIEKTLESGAASGLIKRERLSLERERFRILKNLEGMREMESLPKLLFVVDPGREHIAINEASRLGIPIVALTDTNCDPDPISHVIPGNDDAIRAIKLITTAIADACVEGQEMGRNYFAKEAGDDVVVSTDNDVEIDVVHRKRRSDTAPEAVEATAEEATTEEATTEEVATEEVATEEVATEEVATEEAATEEATTEEATTEEAATEEASTEASE